MAENEQQSNHKFTLPELMPAAAPPSEAATMPEVPASTPTPEAPAPTTEPEVRPEGAHFRDDDAPQESAQFVGEPEQKRQKWPLVVGIILAFILIAGGGSYWYRSNQAAQVEASRDEGYDLLDDAIALIQESDTVVIAIDRSIESQVTEDTLAQIEVLIGQTASVQQTLAQAANMAQQAKDVFVDSEDQELAQHVVDAAGYRIEMLRLGKMLTQLDIDAMSCALYLSETWDLIVAADENMRSAVEVVGGVNFDKLPDAITYNTTALEEIGEAQLKIVEAQRAFATADFSSITSYLVVKKEAVLLAIISDEAAMKNEEDTAWAKNDEYTAKDAEVVAAVAKIPADPMSLIVDAYDAATKDLLVDYREARSNTADSDVFIRAYVGVDEQATTL